MTCRTAFPAILVLMLSTASACSPAQDETPLGTVALALTTTTSTGVSYRLRGADVVLSGATEASIDLDAAYVDEPVIAVRIAEGDYELGLKDGWYLERNAGHGYEIVEAQFVSPNPQFFVVKHEQTTAISLNFQAGVDAISLATGALEVGVGVKPECQDGEWVERGCGPGYQGRQIATCTQGQWLDFGPCELPEEVTEPMCGPGSPEEPVVEEPVVEEPVVEEPVVEEPDCVDSPYVTQGDQIITISTIESPLNATDFYDFSGAVANGPAADYSAAERTTVMLHKDAEGTTSLVVVHGETGSDTNGGKIGLQIFEHSGIRLAAWDGEKSDTEDLPNAEFKWDWGGCCTDGMALNLNAETECITMAFVSGHGITGVDIVTHENGDRTAIANPFEPMTLCVVNTCETESTEEEPVEEPVVEEPVIEEPVEEEPVEDEPVEDEPVEDEPVEEEPVEDEPVEEEPVVEEPVVEEPVVEEPVVEDETNSPNEEEAPEAGTDQAENLEEEATPEGEPTPIISFIENMEAYEIATGELETYIEDFEFFSSGAEVHRAKTGFVAADGFLHSDKVTFDSWHASVLTAGADPSEPVLDGVVVAGDSAKWKKGLEYYGCPWEGGDAAILASAGSNLTSGYDAIQANFVEPVRTVAFDLSLNRFGFTVEVYVEGDTDEPSETFIIEPFDTLVVGAHVNDENAPRITAFRVIPTPHGLGGYGTWWWSVWGVYFAL